MWISYMTYHWLTPRKKEEDKSEPLEIKINSENQQNNLENEKVS